MEKKPLEIIGELEVQPLSIDLQPFSIDLQPFSIDLQPLEVTPMNTEPEIIACDIPTIDAADLAELDELREEMQRDFEELENDPDIKRMLRESEKELDALTACDSLDGSESTSCSGS